MTGLDRPLELQEVEVPIISTVYGISSRMHRSHLLEAESTPGSYGDRKD